EAAVNEVEVARLQGVEQHRNLFGQVLEVVVHGDDHIAPRMAEAAHQRVVLTEIPHELNRGHDPRITLVQPLHDSPRLVGAAVVNENDLELSAPGRQHLDDAAYELLQRAGRAVHRNNHRNLHGTPPGKRRLDEQCYGFL